MKVKAWKTEGVKTNPTLGTVLADTGATAIDTGQYSVKAHINTTATAVVDAEFWAADETVELLRSPRFYCTAGIKPPPNIVDNFPFTRPFRIYLKMGAALASGNIQGTIIVQ